MQRPELGGKPVTWTSADRRKKENKGKPAPMGGKKK